MQYKKPYNPETSKRSMKLCINFIHLHLSEMLMTLVLDKPPTSRIIQTFFLSARPQNLSSTFINARPWLGVSVSNSTRGIRSTSQPVIPFTQSNFLSVIMRIVIGFLPTSQLRAVEILEPFSAYCFGVWALTGKIHPVGRPHTNN